MNAKASNAGVPFEHDAISEDELENVVGGLARAWIGPISAAPNVREAPGDHSAWVPQPGQLEA